jgi:hypothetical protein
MGPMRSIGPIAPAAYKASLSPDAGECPARSAEVRGLVCNRFELEVTMSVLVEIRAAEGGDDAKLLVEEQLKIYARFGARRRL